MLNRIRAAALAVVLGLTCISAAEAGNGLYKIGYLDLDKVKHDYPEAQKADLLKLQLEGQLREIVARANEQLLQAEKANKDKSELERIKHDMQMQINGMQEAFRMMIQNQTAETSFKITSASNDVAKEKGLDMVVERNNVFAGADKLVSCEDVTDAVVKRLTPTKPAAQAAPAAPPK